MGDGYSFFKFYQILRFSGNKKPRVLPHHFLNFIDHQVQPVELARKGNPSLQKISFYLFPYENSLVKKQAF